MVPDPQAAQSQRDAHRRGSYRLGAVLDDPDAGGLGFDATWYADFYHNLSGDTQHAGAAGSCSIAGFGDDRPLAMDTFAGVLRESGNRHIVYHESHDEAGNSPGTERTIRTVVQRAPLVGETRRSAEARSRVAAALSILSAGTPMFLFGEEVGTDTDFTYDNVLAGKVDLWGLRAAAGSGRGMFQYYADLCRLRINHGGLCSRNIDVALLSQRSPPDRLPSLGRGGTICWSSPASTIARSTEDMSSTVSAFPMAAGERSSTATRQHTAATTWATLRARWLQAVAVFEAVIPASGLIVFRRE